MYGGYGGYGGGYGMGGYGSGGYGQQGQQGQQAEPREEQVNKAILFLRNDKLDATATDESKAKFLLGKGVTQAEVDEAKRRIQ